jgi:glycerophosphoryl diester phosphodiesterase
VETLRELGWDGKGSPVRVMSFSPVALNRVQRLAPDLELVLLAERSSFKVLRGSLEPGWIIGPAVEMLLAKPKLQRFIREGGRRAHVFVVNTQSQLDACLDAGVEAVITDRPRHILSALGGV